MMRGLTSGGNPAAKLAAKPDAIRGLTLYRAKVQSLLELGLGFEPCQLGDLTDRVFSLQQQYGLLTNDAMILAVAIRLKANALVSGDKAFRDVKEPDVYAPSDLRLE
jgi:predicted nucleic acid-binding protein